MQEREYATVAEATVFGLGSGFRLGSWQLYVLPPFVKN